MCDLISIIVPVYKVEDYVDRCVKSLISQTYNNYEIILVDDGSPDRCPQICDKWGVQDKRIKVVHKVNGGLSDARNAGIEASSGEYITFVDSDDCVDERFVECLYSQILETGSQIACIGMLEFSDVSQIKVDTVKYETKVYTRKEAIAELFEPLGFQNYACNKMYHRKLFDSVLFPYGKVMEDLATTYRLIEQCDLISYCPAKLYFYFQRANSILHKINRKLSVDWYSLSKVRYLDLQKEYPELYANYQYFNRVILQCYPLLQENEKGYANREFRKNLHYGVADTTLKSKIKVVLFLLSKKLYCYVWMRWNKV